MIIIIQLEDVTYMVPKLYVTLFEITQTDCWITSKILALVHSDIMLLGGFHYFLLVYGICLIDYKKNFRFIN